MAVSFPYTDLEWDNIDHMLADAQHGYCEIDAQDLWNIIEDDSSDLADRYNAALLISRSENTDLAGKAISFLRHESSSDIGMAFFCLGLYIVKSDHAHFLKILSNLNIAKSFSSVQSTIAKSAIFLKPIHKILLFHILQNLRSRGAYGPLIQSIDTAMGNIDLENTQHMYYGLSVSAEDGFGLQ